MISRIFRRLYSRQKPLADMTPQDVGEHLAKKYPITVQKEPYETPKYRCSRWILVNGPVYADEGFFGTIIVEAIKMVDWMTQHAKGVFSSNTTEQKAREYLPRWLEGADTTDETITLLDKYQREVLQGDCLRFLWSDWAKVWCPTCKAWHPRIQEHDFGWVQTGRITLKFDDWHCPENHLIHREKQKQIRLIVR